MDVLTDCEGRLRDTASRKILLEVTLLKMIEARHAVSIDAVLRQLQQLRAEAGRAAAPPPPPRPPRRIPPRPPPFPRPPPSSPACRARRPAIAAPARTGELETLWSQLQEAVGRASPFVRSYLNEAHPLSLAKNLLTIGFDPEFAEHIALGGQHQKPRLAANQTGRTGPPERAGEIR